MLWMMNPQLDIKDHFRTCMPFNPAVSIMCGLRFIYMTTVFGWTTRIFTRSTELVEIIPMLRNQVELNAKWVPLMFFSTWCLFLYLIIVVVVESRGGKSRTLGTLFMMQNLTTLDALLNNVIMFYTIYNSHPSQMETDSNRPSDAVQMAVNSTLVTREPRVVDLDDLVWVSMPSCHPIQVARVVTQEMNLQRYVVADKKRINTFERYQQAGFVQIACLRSSHNFRDWVKSCLEEHNEEERSRSRSVENKQVDFGEGITE